MNKKEVMHLIQKYDIKVKKRFGQNFLIDDNILNKIITQLGTFPFSSVLEIGPGLGSLTKKLIKRFEKVISYEIDPEMIKVLRTEFKENKLKIIEKDILKVNIEEDILTLLGKEKVCLVANLPYYITTPILLKVLEEAKSVTHMVVMMQKEVAERLCGTPKTKDYNNLSVLIQYFTETKKLFNVPPSAFYPEPGVESSVVSIIRREFIENKAIDLPYFLKFNRVIFSKRRKTLLNNLFSVFHYPKIEIEELLLKLNYNKDIRAESLSVSEIVILSNEFYLHLNH